MFTENNLKELQELLTPQQIITDETIRRESVKDYIGYRRYERCDKQFLAELPTCVIKPKNTQEVSKVLSYLNENHIDVVPRTGGSSVTLGIEVKPNGVVLDCSEINEIYQVNEKDMIVSVGCGTPQETLENHLNTLGYTTGHFPQSLPLAQVGGLIATRSTGQLSTLYGGIEDLVVGLEAVLADGTIIEIKDVPRRSAGPDLRHVFIGNEGAFAIITKASLKMFKYMPETRWMNAYGIKGMDNGLDLIREIMVEGYKPAVVRLHDEDEVERSFGGITPEGYDLLMFLTEGPQGIVDATQKAIEGMLEKYDVVDLGKKPLERWLIHRNDVCEELDHTTRYDKGFAADTCEISAVWSEIGNIYRETIARARREMDNLVYMGAHSSHSYIQGTNIYFTFAFAIEKGKDVVKDEYMKLVGIIMEETLKRGGSIAHHHGSGKYRTEWMPQEHGSSYEVMNRLKDVMDPNHILNKGAIIVEK